jgi:hypothetical protein
MFTHHHFVIYRYIHLHVEPVNSNLPLTSRGRFFSSIVDNHWCLHFFIVISSLPRTAAFCFTTLLVGYRWRVCFVIYFICGSPMTHAFHFWTPVVILQRRARMFTAVITYIWTHRWSAYQEQKNFHINKIQAIIRIKCACFMVSISG